MNSWTRIRRLTAAALALGIVAACTGAAASAVPPAVSSAAPSDDAAGPQFYNDVVVDVAGDVDGDVYASGQSITISGDVTGDVIAAGQAVTISGAVGGDVRLAAQNVTITGEVGRGGTIFASTLEVNDSGSFGTDVVGAASRMSIDGVVGRDLVVTVDRLTIDGQVGGSVTYLSERTARVADGAVRGDVQRIDPPSSPALDPGIAPWLVLVGWVLGALYALVAFSVITVLSGLLLPGWLQRVSDHVVPSPWRALLVGLVAAIAVPAALLFLLATIIGAPLALAGALVWSVLTLGTFVWGAFFIGDLVLRDSPHPAVRSLVGGIILIVALSIPWVNIPVWLVMVCLGLGAQILELRRLRPWHRPEVAPPVESARTPEPTDAIREI